MYMYPHHLAIIYKTPGLKEGSLLVTEEAILKYGGLFFLRANSSYNKRREWSYELCQLLYVGDLGGGGRKERNVIRKCYYYICVYLNNFLR